MKNIYDYGKVMEDLGKIREEVSKILPCGIRIHDIVYRPYDMGIFGAKGFSFGLITNDGKRGRGKHFECAPTNLEVNSAVVEILSAINDV